MKFDYFFTFKFILKRSMKKIILAITLFIGIYVSAQKNWSIEECIDYAAKNNLTILRNIKTEELAQKDVEQASFNWLPTVSGYADNKMNVGSFHPSIQKGYYQFSSGFGVQSQVNLYSGGVVKLQKEKSAIDLEASKINTATTINDISIQIANYYLAVLLNKELKQVAQGNLDLSKKMQDQAYKKYSAGTISRAVYVQSEAEVAANVKNVTNAQIEIERSLFNLAMLLQLKDYRGFDIVDVVLPNSITNELYDLDEILEMAYSLQPAIKLAELQLASAKKSTEITKSYLKPKVTGTYSLGTSYADYFNKNLTSTSFFDQWKENIVNVFGVSVSFPIWNQYSYKINIQKALINEDQSMINYLFEKQRVLENVQSAYFEVNSAYAALEASREAVRYAEISYDFAEKSYVAGVINMYDYNKSRNDLMVARSQMLQDKYNFIFKQKVLDFYAGKEIVL